MMMKRIAGIARCVVFLVILACVLGKINDILEPNYNFTNADWPSNSTYDGFYEMKENSIDVLFLGSSVAANSFSPLQIYKDYQIRSYNLGSEQQSPFLSYFWLKEALRYQKPQAVVIDLRFCVNMNAASPINTLEGLTRKCLDAMHFSPVKVEAVRTLCKLDPAHSEMSYYLTNLRYHDRWKSLEKSDFNWNEYNKYHLMGHALSRDIYTGEYYTFDSKDSESVSNEFHQLSMEYMDKIALLCKENGIELILVNVLGNVMDDGIHNGYTALAERHGIDYYNFSETGLHNALAVKHPEESVFGHASPKGAVKMSQYMGGLLADVYGVEGIKDEQWEEKLSFYENALKMHELPSIDDLESYLAMIPDDDCTVFMAVKEDASAQMPEGAKAQLKRLGLNTEWNEDMYRQPYMAILSPHGNIEGAMGYQAHSSRFEGGRYDVQSIGYQEGNAASILINGKEYSLKSRGLNIVVYSHYQDKVIDSVNFDTHVGVDAVRH